MHAPNGWPAIAAFYGWDRFRARHAAKSPEGFAAAVKAEWEPQMVLVKAPAGFSFYFDVDADGMRDPNENMRGIRVHPIIADSLAAILQEIGNAGLWRFVEPCAGGYTYRAIREIPTKLSLHSLGAAVDFDALKNPMKWEPERTRLGTEPGLGVVRIFNAHGWTWGGLWDRPDAMHFQYGSGA
jgi:hypothetical protein